MKETVYSLTRTHYAYHEFNDLICVKKTKLECIKAAKEDGDYPVFDQVNTPPDNVQVDEIQHYYIECHVL